jgi:formylglycine-generating enzyme required for sulfatase activity
MKRLLLLLGLLPGFVQALDAPVVGITATTDGDSVYVTLAWDPVPGAARYQVFRQDQILGTSTLVSDNATSPFQTAVPTGWNWQLQPDVLKFFKVDASDAPLHPVPMIRVLAGTFQMGQVGVAEPVHQVTLTHDFWLGETEITNAQFREAALWAIDQGYLELSLDRSMYAHNRYLGILPNNSDNYPVVNINWFAAACYCDWLSIADNLIPFYNGEWSSSQSHNPYLASYYRLPTVSEWEFAARYNDGRRYPWGDDPPVDCIHGNFNWCLNHTSQVGSYPTGDSMLGFHDMAGNVWEWTNDWLFDYSTQSVTDPYGDETGTIKAFRGGHFRGINYFIQSASHYTDQMPDFIGNDLGFRICRTAQ